MRLSDLIITIFWLSISILSFGLGRDKQKHGCLSNIRIRRPTWWKHLDLIFYFCLIPQRIKMYMYAKQFNSNTYDDLESLGVIMTVIEIGNAINKLLFWWQFGKNHHNLVRRPEKIINM